MTSNSSFFGDLLNSIADRGARCSTGRPQHRRTRAATLVERCQELLSGKGEASCVALAAEVLSRYGQMKTGERIAFFESLLKSSARTRSGWKRPSPLIPRSPARPPSRNCMPPASRAGRSCSAASTWPPAPPPNWCACASISWMPWPRRKDLTPVDSDFTHLFSSWFNRGFLVLRRIDWSTPANVLEKIIRYEAVHAIRDWNDLRARVDSPDRHCYAFFHPALVDEPLIFVEVALMRETPGAIAPNLDQSREPIAPEPPRRRSSIPSPTASAASAGQLRQLPHQAGGGGDLPRDPLAHHLCHALARARLPQMAGCREA